MLLVTLGVSDVMKQTTLGHVGLLIALSNCVEMLKQNVRGTTP
jgi:hypothetical protein